MKDKSKIKKFLFIAILIFTGLSCKDENHQIIPYVPVNLSIDKGSLLSMGVNTSIVRDGYGFRGILVYRYDESTFKAFDRCCSNYPNDDAAVVVDNSGTATCPVCKSTFNLFADGMVTKGPAKYPLQQYKTYYDGTRLTVSN